MEIEGAMIWPRGSRAESIASTRLSTECGTASSKSVPPHSGSRKRSGATGAGVGSPGRYDRSSIWACSALAALVAVG